MSLIVFVCLGWVPPASAAVVERYPAPAQREVAIDPQGWTAAQRIDGACFLPGFNCPILNGSYVATNGAGGVADGFLQASFTTYLAFRSVGEVELVSPVFTVPRTVESASLLLDRRADVASLAGVAGAATQRYTLVDVTTGARTTIADAVPVASTASWATVDAGPVPASALVAGHDYRLELLTKFQTPASGAVSGSVGFDRVSLVTSRLTPPTGLTTPSVAIDVDGIHVEGAVDPAGLATVVRAEYGPTTSYGTTSSAQLVTGTGLQGFAIPLVGLTPGQPYHLRLRATSSDGTATSQDVTFTAPPLPPNGAPSVSGSDRSRSRTVTFDRPAGVLAASLQLTLDGAVVATVPVASGATQAITLPDTDGIYGVRVRRTTGSGSSTSPDTFVLLDRVAPSTTQLLLDAQPRVSSTPARLVTFERPSDAQVVESQVLTELGMPVGPPSTVAGSSDRLALPPVDGSYRVRLTFTDAAGNASTALGPVLTLDTLAPDAGPAPSVSGSVADRARAVSFTRASDAALAVVEVLGDGGDVVVTATATGNSATVVLPALDGTYRVRVLQADLLGNASRTATASVALDTTPPDAGPAPVVSGASDLRRRDVAFTRAADASTVTVEIVDAAGGVVATVPVPSDAALPILLPDLDGVFGVRVRQTDAFGNAAVTAPSAVTLDRQPGFGAVGPVPPPSAPWVAPPSPTPGPSLPPIKVSLPTPTPGPERLASPAPEATAVPSPTPTALPPSPTPDPVRDAEASGVGGVRAEDPGRPAPSPSPAGEPAASAPGRPAEGRRSTVGYALAACARTGLVLTRVQRSGDRIRAEGASRFASGVRVAILGPRGSALASTSIGADGRFAATFAASLLPEQAADTKLFAEAGSVRSRSLHLERANDLERVTVDDGVVTITGTLGPAYRSGRLRWSVVGARHPEGCTSKQRLAAVAAPSLDRRTGRYRLQVRAPEGSGSIVLRALAHDLRTATTAYSVFAVR